MRTAKRSFRTVMAALLQALLGFPAFAAMPAVDFDRGFDLKALTDHVRVQAKEAAPLQALALNAPSTDNVQRLVSYISARAVNGNGFDEDYALNQLFAVRKVTDVQAKVLKTIVDYARDGNDIHEDYAFHNVLLRPAMTETHGRLLEALVREARYENNFDEDAAFNAVLDTPKLSAETAQTALGIFRRARYENGLDDYRLFVMALRSGN
ncbi:MAG TPA: hypothetical protein DCM05_01700 [Elusimicrobia bacterium]|nr:hypothetical protein [Elusimicrobiota bacterium]